MPLHIQKKNGKFCVVDPAGKQFGCHPSKQKVVDQIAAIESNKAKSGLELMVDNKISSLDAELGISKAQDGGPPIMIASDGTPEGTTLAIHGQLVDFNHLEVWCNRDGDYHNCEVAITISELDANGIKVQKTLRLRKDPPEDQMPKPY
jgi:hypothetical protein